MNARTFPAAATAVLRIITLGLLLQGGRVIALAGPPGLQLSAGKVGGTPLAAAAGEAEARQMGVMVQEIKAILAAPAPTPASADEQDALAAIAKYGTDSRHYVMIRGWLREELAGVESQLASVSGPALQARLTRKAGFLKKAIRRIDLE